MDSFSFSKLTIFCFRRSKLTYPAAFTGKTREIHLDGQAFFDIHKNPHKPFIVHTSEMEVQALGTAFEVFDYDIESKSETVLLNGKVKIGINNSKGDRAEFILSPNEKMVYDQQADSAYVLTVNADKYTSWRKQKIVSFENEKLSMIIPRLEQWYGPYDVHFLENSRIGRYLQVSSNFFRLTARYVHRL